MDETVETIAAPITAPGSAAVSVIRLSGPKVRDALQKIALRGTEALENPRAQVFSPVLDLSASENRGVDSSNQLESSAVLDYALVTFFPAPNSFTGEDIAEISLHGSPYLQERFLLSLLAVGIRSAFPGEFTSRAFANGKLDLAQAEAVADLISAETDAQARIAREQLEGRLSKAISDLGEPLRDLLAQIEANIDFPDEGIDPDTEAQWLEDIQSVDNSLARYIASFRTGRICRDGANVVIVGLPNAGKSSLLNRIVGENRAIVTAIPGTTRDSIEERVNIHGLAIRLWDTAGLAHENYVPDEVEKIGIQQSWQRLKSADLVVFLFDGTKDFSANQSLFSQVEKEARKIILVRNKSDLKNAQSENTAADVSTQIARKKFGLSAHQEVVPISAKTGEGIDGLYGAIAKRLVGDELVKGSILISTARHHEALLKSREALVEAQNGISARDPAEFVAVSIRATLGYLSEIIGVTTTEDILGRIFSKFCIGK